VLEHGGTVARSSGKRSFNKRPCGYYCSVPQSQVQRHWFRKHKVEKEVVEIDMCNIRIERRQLIARLRNLGNHHHNARVFQKGEGELTVTHRKSEGAVASEYVLCDRCYSYVKKREVWRHKRKFRKPHFFSSFNIRTVAAIQAPPTVRTPPSPPSQGSDDGMAVVMQKLATEPLQSPPGGRFLYNPKTAVRGLSVGINGIRLSGETCPAAGAPSGADHLRRPRTSRLQKNWRRKLKLFENDQLAACVNYLRWRFCFCHVAMWLHVMSFAMHATGPGDVFMATTPTVGRIRDI